MTKKCCSRVTGKDAITIDAAEDTSHKGARHRKVELAAIPIVIARPTKAAVKALADAIEKSGHDVKICFGRGMPIATGDKASIRSIQAKRIALHAKSVARPTGSAARLTSEVARATGHKLSQLDQINQQLIIAVKSMEKLEANTSKLDLPRSEGTRSNKMANA